MLRKIVNKFLLALIILTTLKTEALGFILKELKTQQDKNKTKIILTFEDQTPEAEVNSQDKKIEIFLPKTKVLPIFTPKISEDIYQINISNKKNGILIEIWMKNDFNTLDQEKSKDKIIIYAFNQKKKENIFPYQLPPTPEEISIPFTNTKYKGQRISLDLQNADVRSVFRMLSEIGNVNIVLGEEITGKVTLKLKNVPWDQVLDIIMARFGLGKVEIDGVIYIAPLKKLQRQAEELRSIKRTLAEGIEEGPLQTEYITVNYVNACELINGAKEEMSIKSILSDKGVASCDPRTNILVIKDTKENIEAIKRLLSILDAPTKQVLIEARIVEASSNFVRNLGIQWFGGYYKTNEKTSFRLGPSNDIPVGKEGRPAQEGGILNSNTSPFGPIVDLGVPFTSKLGLAIGHITKTSALLLDLHLSTMEQQGQGKIISSPIIITRDNGEAIIKQGYKVPYLELTDQGTATTKFIDADLTLKVVPHILPNNEIRLEINIDKSEPDWAKQVNGVPAILTRSAQTYVRIPNNGTVVIGGLKIAKRQESYNSVPGLSKLPAIGNLFKNSQKSNEEQELLIFITAKVITSAVEEIDY